MTQSITIFRNIRETETAYHIDISTVLGRIKDGTTKDLVKLIRSEKNSGARNELKKGLPAICFSGIFNNRNDASQMEHSGLICLDFDGYSKKKELLSHKENFSKDPYVYCVFTSPSGNGLKVLEIGRAHV